MEQEPPNAQLNYSKPDEARMFPLIEEQRQSDLTVKTFCEKKGIAIHSYYYWNKKYRDKNKDASANRSPFTRLQLQEEAPGRLFCELTTPSGRRLRFYQPVSAVFLQSFL
jgi:hypothetical protein